MRNYYVKPEPVDCTKKSKDVKPKKESGLICAYKINFKLLRPH